MKTSTGYYSTGNYSIGNWSTGYRSTGDRSTGNWSTGDRSTGNRSTGNWSTGYRSTGNYSTGNWSISDYSTGHFSTIDYSGFSAFDKPITKKEWDKAEIPSFMYFDLTKWVDEEDMTDKEKEDNQTYKTTEGYLKVFGYQEAWKIAWDKASKEEKEMTLRLPNFDAKVFKIITGIDVNNKQTVLTMDEIASKFGVNVNNLKITKE